MKRISNKGDFIFEKGKLLFNRVGPIKAIKQISSYDYDDDNNIVKHKNIRAPEKRGLWAFPYPIFDPFFVTGRWSGQYGSDKKTKLNDNLIRQIKKRIKGLNRRIEQLTVHYNSLEDSNCTKSMINWDIEDIKYMVIDLQEALDKGEISKTLLNGTKLNQKFQKTQKFWWGSKIYAHFAPKGLHPTLKDEWYCFQDAHSYLRELRKQVIQFSKTDFRNGITNKCIVKGIGQGDMGLSSDHLEVFIPYRG